MASAPTREQTNEIVDAIAAGKKIEAIRLYRRATGSELKNSKQFIEQLTVELRQRDPTRFPAKSGKGCLAVLVLLAIVLIVAMQ